METGNETYTIAELTETEIHVARVTIGACRDLLVDLCIHVASQWGMSPLEVLRQTSFQPLALDLLEAGYAAMKDTPGVRPGALRAAFCAAMKGAI